MDDSTPSRVDLETLPIRFASKVPALFGLPPIEGNVAEGIVIKPDMRARFGERGISKRKLPEFDDQRFDESVPFDPRTSLDIAAIIELARKLVNPARIASARSKVGPDRRAVEEEVVLDVIVDLEAAFPTALRNLDGADEERLRRHVSELAQGHL